jgi:hypothetical protein
MVNKELQEKQVTKFKKIFYICILIQFWVLFKNMTTTIELLEKESNVTNNPIKMIKLDIKF